MEEKDALYYRDLIFYIEVCAGIIKGEDSERFKHLDKKTRMIKHIEDKHIYYAPTEFSYDVFLFAKEIVNGYEWFKIGAKSLVNYPQETAELLKTYFIRIAGDYSETPGSRYIQYGPYSGEDFRDNYLEQRYLKCLQAERKLVIDFDGGYGYSVGFLEEVFGGLIRKGYHATDLINNIIFISEEEPQIIEEIMIFMSEEEQRRFPRERK